MSLTSSLRPLPPLALFIDLVHSLAAFRLDFLQGFHALLERGVIKL